MTRPIPTCLDFEREWQRLRPLLADPLATRALDAGMRALLAKTPIPWFASNGPWLYSTRERHPVAPERDSPDWYRCYGGCHAVAPWCAAVGKLLYPNLNWEVGSGEAHSTGVGFDGDNIVMVADILRRFPESPEMQNQSLRKQKLKEAAQLILADVAPDGRLQSTPLLKRIEHLEMYELSVIADEL